MPQFSQDIIIISRQADEKEKYKILTQNNKDERGWTQIKNK